MGTFTHYPYAGQECVSIVAYFQNIMNWLAGYRIVSGCAVTRASASSVTIASGSYMKGGEAPTTYTYAGATLTGVTAASASAHRYDLIYLDTADGAVKRAAGTEAAPTKDGSANAAGFLDNNQPQPVDITSEASILLAVICVDESGIRSTDNGDYSVAGVADMRMKANIGSMMVSYLNHASEAHGDVIIRKSTGWDRLAIGTVNKYLMSNGAGADPSWNTVQYLDYGGANQFAASQGTTLRTRQVSIQFGTPGVAISAGIAAFLPIKFTGTITSVELVADQSGSAVVDIWKDTYANYPPTIADTITASAKPTLSAATKYTDSTLTGWTKAITSGDYLVINVDSASTVCVLTLTLTILVT